MKRLVLVFVLMFAFVAVAFAQGPHKGHVKMHKKGMMNQMKMMHAPAPVGTVVVHYMYKATYPVDPYYGYCANQYYTHPYYYGQSSYYGHPAYYGYPRAPYYNVGNYDYGRWNNMGCVPACVNLVGGVLTAPLRILDSLFW